MYLQVKLSLLPFLPEAFYIMWFTTVPYHQNHIISQKTKQHKQNKREVAISPDLFTQLLFNACALITKQNKKEWRQNEKGTPYCVPNTCP